MLHQAASSLTRTHPFSAQSYHFHGCKTFVTLFMARGKLASETERQEYKERGQTHGKLYCERLQQRRQRRLRKHAVRPRKAYGIVARVPYGATSCEVGLVLLREQLVLLEFQSTHLMRGGTAEVTNRYRVLTGDF